MDADSSGVPRTIEPAEDGVDLAGWTRAHRDTLEALLSASRALLFRGFRIDSPEALRRFTDAVGGGPPLEYVDRSSPRTEVADRVYLSTTYPASERILLHNEGTYHATWPRKIYFACARPATRGGQTPIADVRRVAARIADPVMRRFDELGVLYVRWFHASAGLTWQETFQTDDPAEAVRVCDARDIEARWSADGVLETRQRRPAFRVHPVTGERLWFNHAAFFHASSHEPEMRAALEETFGSDRLPHQTYYGDGSEIPDDVVRQIREACDAEERLFDWRSGDVLMLDNMTVAHARRPYEGPRRILTAMTEPHGAEGGAGTAP